MSSPFNHEAEPFQGFTEFDEFESLDEFDEFGEEEFGDLETFESDFEFEPEFDTEEERGGRRMPPAAAGGRRPMRAPARGIGRRGPAGRPRVPARRPGMRPPRGMRPGGMGPSRRPGPGRARPPGRPVRPRPRPPRPRPMRPRPFPIPVAAYPGIVVPQPIEDRGPAGGASPPSDIGSCPAVGRFGNWLRSGNQVIILLDEDETPIDEGASGASPAAPAEGAAAAPPSDGPPTPSNGAASPSNGAASPPPEAAAGPPTEGADSAPAEGAQGEFGGRGGLSRRRLSLVQQALNRLGGLRIAPYGIPNQQTHSALRSYQQQKGLIPHGQADYETELALADDLAREVEIYETEFSLGDPCLERCRANFNSCRERSQFPLECIAQLSACLRSCAGPVQPIPPIPIPPTPLPPKPCPPRPTLRIGSRGPAVNELQVRLNARGASPPLNVDGIFGPRTDAAVRGFQRSRGLVVDGIVGPNTWSALGC